jgi:hypothetical protein
MRTARNCVVVLLTAFVASCSSISPPLTRVEDVGPSDGVLLVRFHTALASGLLNIHHGPIGLPYAGFQVWPNEPAKIVKIRGAQGLRISTNSVGALRAYFDVDRLNFDVKPGTITYIGDIYVDERPDRVSLRVLDRENDTKEEAKRLYPHFFEKFRFEKSIASQRSRPRESSQFR